MTENYWGDQNTQQVQPAQQQPMGQPAQQPVQPAQPYTQPYAQPFAQPEVTSLGGWVLNLFLAAIPIVGLVLLFVWAFGSTPDESKKNWARANLIWILVVVVIYVILFAVMGVSFVNLYNSGSLSSLS